MYEGITEVGNNTKRKKAVSGTMCDRTTTKNRLKGTDSVKEEAETVTEILHQQFDHSSSS